MPQNEIINPVSLLDDKGQPQNFGWSKHDNFSYDSALSGSPRHSMTETDRYIVFSPTHMIVFEISDDGWLGHTSISVISLRDKNRSTQIFKSIAPLGDYEMPSSSEKGSIRWRRKKIHLDFICMEGGARIIKVDVPRFGRHKSLRGALVLNEYEGSQSLVACQPWRNEKSAFRYLRCSPWFIAEGVIQYSSAEIFFSRGNAWGIFDWTRSVRPKADIRYWAAACGMSDSKLISFCVGYSQADSSNGTENGFFIDGKIYKLNQVTFHIPLSNWLSPWRFTSNDNKLEMTFNPHQERIDNQSLLFYNSKRRQVFGIFSGKIQLDDDSIIEFNNLTGFAERCKMRF
ncbi:MAG: DUF2804 domain-containing protein [Treponema sp.]|jgi:hypothetical protein|nr:DUF2804 domain-containing protein [Treponema sp.]